MIQKLPRWKYSTLLFVILISCQGSEKGKAISKNQSLSQTTTVRDHFLGTEDCEEIHTTTSSNAELMVLIDILRCLDLENTSRNVQGHLVSLQHDQVFEIPKIEFFEYLDKTPSEVDKGLCVAYEVSVVPSASVGNHVEFRCSNLKMFAGQVLNDKVLPLKNPLNLVTNNQCNRVNVFQNNVMLRDEILKKENYFFNQENNKFSNMFNPFCLKYELMKSFNGDTVYVYFGVNVPDGDVEKAYTTIIFSDLKDFRSTTKENPQFQTYFTRLANNPLEFNNIIEEIASNKFFINNIFADNGQTCCPL